MKSIARIHYSFLTTVALAIVGDAFAGSATWKAHPATNDWNAAANWTPQIVPNSPSDIATFIDSDKTSISLSAFTDVDRIVFEAGANAFTIKTDTEAQPLRIFGAGIINNSGVTQNFVAPLREGRFNFVNSSTAGSDTVFTMESSLPSMGSGGQINFFDSSSADHGTFLFAQSTVSGAFGGEGSFFGASTAAHSTFIVNGGASSGAYGAIVGFDSTSTAGQGTFTISGGTGNNAGGGTTAFLGNSTAGNATLIANGGSNGGLGGSIFFEEHSYGGEARVELFGNGKLDISLHGPAGITVGSIEGNGRIFLGARDLTVGRNNLSTTFLD